MGKRVKKKGEAGAAKNFITRNQAIRKLQLPLPDFRKLCIWKGIYPREPRNRKKASKSSTPSTTFYYGKDIQYLLHEPLLEKFREQKALEKKITRALGRGDVGDASRLEKNAARPEKTGRPHYTLDHVVRERYPTFIDALRDLDDCLSMLFLFANLPSTSAVPAKMIARCERLCFQFQHYLIVSHSLRKSFLSIKGIYYQATIQGQDIMWLVPYKFKLSTAGDIDFRIMGTFVEFYMTLLGFVNFRLYTTVGLKYPPKFDQAKDDQSGELAAFTLEGMTLRDDEKPKQITNGSAEFKPNPKVQAVVDRVVKGLGEATENGNDEVERDQPENEAEETSTALDKFVPVLPGGDELPQPENEADVSKLFSDCTFYLSRETPRQPLEFLLKSFGCKRVGWDAVLGGGAYTTNELDPAITHQIVDRPPVIAAMDEGGDGEDNQTAQKIGPNRRVLGRIYVQPQWVWDSVNDMELKRPDLYAPGAPLPPHLSPFVKSDPGRYDPTMPLDAQLPEGAELEDSDEEIEDEDQELDAIEGGMEVDDEEDLDEDEDGDGEFGGFSDDESEPEEAAEDEDEDEDVVRRREIEAELSGASIPVKKVDAKAKARNALSKKAREEAEEIDRAKGMLSKKKRKLFEQMQYSNNKKSAEDLRLMAKRRKLEKEKKKTKTAAA